MQDRKKNLFQAGNEWIFPDCPASPKNKQLRSPDMKMEEIRKIAVEKGVSPGKYRKAELIRAIQRSEGNRDCFESGLADRCGQTECLSRPDCA